MSVDVNTLRAKSDQELHQYVRTIQDQGLQELFERMWHSIRQMQLFGGQARSAASTEALALSQLAISVAAYANSETLRGEAHRMMAYVLNANERYEDAILHYTQAIMFWKRPERLKRSPEPGSG